MVGVGGVGEAWLLGGPIEESGSERVLVEEEGVDDSGDDGGAQ